MTESYQAQFSCFMLYKEEGRCEKSLISSWEFHMVLRDYLRTIDLARAGGISVQQVRNYEALGLLPPASRSKSGYRLYTQRHLAALKRRECEQTLSALHALAKQPTPEQSSRYSQGLRVGEAAKQVGVRVSALHFWEQQGLLHPVRDQSSRYRLYDEQQMHRLRVVVLLREAGYDFKVILSVLDELAAGRPEQAIVAVEKRREELTRTSWVCIDALASFQRYVREFCGDLL